MSDATETTDTAALFACAERLAHARSFDQVVDVVRSAARSIIGAEGITFVRCEGDECVYIAEDAIEPLWAGRRFNLAGCASGWVMQNGEAAIIPDIYADDRVPHDAYRPTFVKSMAMMPVRAGAARAAIGAYWSRAGIPDPRAVKHLQMIASFVGAAMENVALQTSFELLNRTGAAIAAERDLDRVVQLITDAGVELTGAEFGAFFYNLVNEEGESYMLYSLSGVPREAFSKFPMPRNTAVFAPTFSGEGVVRSANIRLDPRYGTMRPARACQKGIFRSRATSPYRSLRARARFMAACSSAIAEKRSSRRSTRTSCSRSLAMLRSRSTTSGWIKPRNANWRRGGRRKRRSRS
jgi:GAF domain-containing protein